MDYLSRYMVIGLILLSSLSSFAEDGSSSTPAQQQLDNNKKEGPPTYLPDPSKAVPADETAGGTRSPTPEAIQGTEAEKIPNSKENINAIVKDVESPTLKCMAAQKAAEPSLTKIKNGVKMFNENYDNCLMREAKANQFCLESRNPDIKNFIAVAQVLVGGLSGMMDACSKFGKVMDAGNKALTAYQGLCSSWRGYCNSACGDTVKGLNMIQAGQKEIVPAVTKAAQAEAAKGPTNPQSVPCGQVASTYAAEVQKTTEPITKELKADANDYRPVAQKFATCKSYARELASAGVGLIGMLNSFGQANKCEKDTNSSSAGTGTNTAVDCTIPANKTTKMECICQDNPRMAGCNSGLDSATMAKSGDALRGTGSGDYTSAGSAGGPGNLGVGDGEGGDLAAKGADGGGSSLPGAPSGGGGGLGGGSGFGGGAPDGSVAKKANGLNTNILGGEGGGGGGGGWGGYGSDRDPALRQYLPGGAKDPNAAGMAGAAASKQVTSQGGKSNWEKVKDRYRDNKPTLLGY